MMFFLGLLLGSLATLLLGAIWLLSLPEPNPPLGDRACQAIEEIERRTIEVLLCEQDPIVVSAPPAVGLEEKRGDGPTDARQAHVPVVQGHPGSQAANRYRDEWR